MRKQPINVFVFRKILYFPVLNEVLRLQNNDSQENEIARISRVDRENVFFFLPFFDCFNVNFMVRDENYISNKTTAEGEGVGGRFSVVFKMLTIKKFFFRFLAPYFSSFLPPSPPPTTNSFEKRKFIEFLKLKTGEK